MIYLPRLRDRVVPFLLLVLLCGGFPTAELFATTGEALPVVQSFMAAMGQGDLDAMASFMAEDLVWHNEGDPAIP